MICYLVSGFRFIRSSPRILCAVEGRILTTLLKALRALA